MIGNLVYALHISLDDAWNYTFPEYYAVVRAGDSESENQKFAGFTPEELEELERLKKIATG